MNVCHLPPTQTAMKGETLLDRPEVNFSPNSTYGIDKEDEGTTEGTQVHAINSENEDVLMKDLFGTANHGNGSEDNLDNWTEQDLNYRQFSPGFSDDEGSGEAFERSWPTHEAKKKAAKKAKDKKSPRRSDSEEDDSQRSAWAKKPRQSLFGDHQDKEDGGRLADLLASSTPGHGLGNRMSSLNLDQQVDGDEDLGQPVSTGFGLACSDIGSVRNSPAPSDDEIVIPPDDVVPYELRQNINRKKAFTYLDTDKSGNWDPEQEAKERAVKLVRAKAAKRDKKERRKKKTSKDLGPEDYAMKCIVKLPFGAFGNVRNITDEEQNWPEHWSDIESEQEREQELYRQAYRSNTPNRRLQLPLEDPADKVDDLTGHPAARGCKQCRRSAHHCSMIKDGRYPCKECTEDGGECQPIKEPKVKGRCKQCDQAGKETCSLENNPTLPICDHCANNETICEALPPFDYKAQRVDLDEIVYGPDRPSVACTTCHIHKKRCSLKRKEDKPPCKFCKKTGLGCKFTDVSKEELQISAVKRSIQENAPGIVKPSSEFFTAEDLAEMDRPNDAMPSREATPIIEMVDAEGNNGMLTKITTSFAHPIRFVFETSASSDCNFCQLPIFGMVGHFEREVHVIRWDTGTGYAEVGGGHCPDEGETTMCKECSYRRVQILFCSGHEFEPLADAGMDHDALAEALAGAEAGGADIQYQLQRWCSMCFSPASYGCHTVQPSVLEDTDEEAEVEGCNLRLCAICEEALRVDFGGNLDQMATELDRMPKISEADEVLGAKIEGRPRADVGFLTQNGLLMRTLNTQLE